MDSQPVKDIEAALRDMESLAQGSSSSKVSGTGSPKAERTPDTPKKVQKKPKKTCKSNFLVDPYADYISYAHCIAFFVIDTPYAAPSCR